MGRVDIYPNSVIQGPPSGQLGYAEITTGQTTISTEVDISGLSVTVSVPIGRRIRISAQVGAQRTVVDGLNRLRIKEGATTLQLRDVPVRGALEGSIVHQADVVITPSAGSHTYKLSYERVTGSGTVNADASSTEPGFILVEDITGTFWNGSLVTAGIIASEQWISFTPTLTQTGTVTNTITYARYQKLGRVITANCQLAVTGSGSGGVKVQITLPVSPAFSTNQIVGSFWLVDQSAATNYSGIALSESGGPVIGIPNSVAAGLGQASFTAALASGDTVGYAITYESLT